MKKIKETVRNQIEEVLKEIAIHPVYSNEIILRRLNILIQYDIALSLRTIAENISCKNEVSE